VSKNKVTQNRHVEFVPNETTRAEKLPNARKDKKTFAAVVYDVNENTVDLNVFCGPDTPYITRVPYVDDAKKNESYWQWPTVEK
jgi:hypothetical protein